ncbi:hypothetical protein [Streptomyces sp. NPDC096323]|uniref:hypothetical protein n=1 Tax=Streptomyces sp. NPDC096323 TaxID=3155822 RepID=UPI0033331FFD
MRGLEARGRVARADGKPGWYVAAPPQLAPGGLLAARRYALEQAEASMAALVEDFHLAAARHARADLVELLTGIAPIALLPLLSAAEADRVHVPTALVALFEGVWAAAGPVLLSPTGGVEREPQSEGPDDTDPLILSLMLTGLTDHAVAGYLGLSLRTMQRRIRRLMQLADVTTRIQMGWHAYE